MRFRLRTLTRNWQLKLAAFALAVLLWVVVSAEQVTSEWLPATVEVDIRDPDRTLVQGPEPDEVRVRFSGARRELWELAFNRPRLRVVVTESDAARVLIPLEPQMVRIPAGLNTVAAREVRPTSVRLMLEELASREVPVRVQVGRGLPEGFTLVDSLRVNPARVRASGPADALVRLQSVPTRPLNLSGVEDSFVRYVSLDTAGLRGVRFHPSEVQVSGEVERLAERTIRVTPFVPRAGTLVTPGEVEAVLTGPESVVGNVSPEDVRAVVPSEEIPALIPPEGILVPVVPEQSIPGLQVRFNPARVRLTPLAQPEGGEVEEAADTVAPGAGR